MLAHMHIRHFAIIDDTEIDLDRGMTALTGETGAGKSILIDALGQVLGDRASIDLIQQGADRAEITATFDIAAVPEARRWLVERDLDDDDECLLRRVIASNGKSRASINGRPVPAQTLREIGASLVRIHGQHEHQSLARPAEQRQLLDRYVASRYQSPVADTFDAWQDAEGRLQDHLDASRSRQERLDLIEFQLQEFDSLDMGGTAVADIEAEHRWLANVEQALASGSEALGNLDDDAGALVRLSAAVRPLEALVDVDERLREALDLVDSAVIQTGEAASLLRHHLSTLEHDDARLGWLDNRLAALHRLARKHQVDMAGLGAVETALRDEFDRITSPETGIEALESTRDKLRRAYDEAAARLSADRQHGAASLSGEVTASMHRLNMTAAEFIVEVDTDAAPGRHGRDLVRFMVQPNAGVTAAPLSRIASGGELSRISLCLQLATLSTRSVPSLLFDEVDSGVGGAVAETVGQLLRAVGEQAQVLCVTHLPQVAAQAHHHLRVVKTVTAGTTRTGVESLDGEATQEEIARMLGGARVTRKTRQHAREMIDAVR